MKMLEIVSGMLCIIFTGLIAFAALFVIAAGVAVLVHDIFNNSNK